MLSPVGAVRWMKRKQRSLLVGISLGCLYWYLTRSDTPFISLSSKNEEADASSLVFGPNGIATLEPRSPHHPMLELVAQAEQRWKDLLADQSDTVSQAAAEYTRRYNLKPPAGFDRWFAFCQKHDIAIVDDYDQMMKDILPHYALRPEVFIARSRALNGTGFTYTLDINSARIKATGERSTNTRPKQLVALIDGFRADLPGDFELAVTGSDHDTGGTVLGQDQRRRAMELVSEGKRTGGCGTR
jgi:hypothetical protein